MFFSTYVLTKQGPLAKVWLAAHWDRRLTRGDIKVVDLEQTIVHIVRPVVPIALRTSGELLVGVVRIYALKVRHLLKDATEATLLLRVTTAAPATAGKDGKDGKGAARVTVDGALVTAKGDVEAVTLAGADGAPLGVGDGGASRFDAIADLLSGAGAAGAAAGGAAEGGEAAPAWYTVQASSQPLEEPHGTQRDYAEIARMRADLMAFGERASGSGDSGSKSSLSSIEKGRGSAAADLAGGAVPYPPVGADALELGVALPDDPHGFPALDSQPLEADALPADPFALPDLTAPAAAPAAPAAAAHAARRRPANVLDLAATTLSREAIERAMAARADLLNAEPRRGPLDAAEERDRWLLAGAAAPGDAPALSAAALAPLASPALRALYAAALQQSVAAAVDEAARASQSLAAAAAAAADAPPALEDDYLQPGGADALEEAQEPRGAAGEAGLSASARHTLARLAERLRAAAAKGRKRSRAEAEAEAPLVGEGCALRELCDGMRRREAARTFVDVLGLASRQMLALRQTAPAADVRITVLAPALEALQA